jgi:hypothetical protein
MVFIHKGPGARQKEPDNSLPEAPQTMHEEGAKLKDQVLHKF